MNYGGSGTSKDDPIVIDTLEDLAPLMQKSAGSILHIAFPEVYSGDKVIDLRAAGWNPDGRININWSTDNHETIRRYVYFNGWTILGLSIMNSYFFNLVISGSSTNASEKQVYIYDLIIKNAYILGGGSEAWLFRSEASYGSRIIFYRCKFSMMLDSQTTSTYAFGYIADEEEFQFFQCSFNIQVNSTSKNLKTWIMNDRSRNRWLMRNCIMNIRSTNFRPWDYNADSSLVICANMQFSKIVGDVRCVAGNSAEVPMLYSPTGCFYNVVDMTFRHYRTDGTVYFGFGSGKNIVNYSNFKYSNGNAMAASNVNGNNKSVITTAQMLDADYLNSINFIVGDPPSD